MRASSSRVFINLVEIDQVIIKNIEVKANSAPSRVIRFCLQVGASPAASTRFQGLFESCSSEQIFVTLELWKNLQSSSRMAFLKMAEMG